jgi:hypothetical protein
MRHMYSRTNFINKMINKILIILDITTSAAESVKNTL